MSKLFSDLKDVFKDAENRNKQQIIDELNKPKPVKYLYGACALILLGIVIVAWLVAR